MALGQPGLELGVGWVAVGNGVVVNGAVGMLEVDLAPVAQAGHGQSGQLFQHRLEVGRAGQHGADLGQVAGLLVGPQGVGLGGQGGALG